MKVFSTIILVVGLIFVASAGCKTPPTGTAQPEPAKSETDIEEGEWIGTWSSTKQPGTEGMLDGFITKSTERWSAIIVVSDADMRSCYSARLTGTKVDDGIKFTGTTELKKASDYYWEGIARRNTFTGTYKGELDEGKFTLRKK